MLHFLNLSFPILRIPNLRTLAQLCNCSSPTQFQIPHYFHHPHSNLPTLTAQMILNDLAHIPHPSPTPLNQQPIPVPECMSPLMQPIGQTESPFVHDRQPPSHLKDCLHYNSVSVPNPITLGTSLSTPYPISHFVSYFNLSPAYKSFSLALLTKIEPTSYPEANKLECWQKAMMAEIEAFELNQSWVLLIYHLMSHQLATSGFTKSNIAPMVLLIGTKCVWLPKSIHKWRGWIILTLSHRWPK